MVNNFLPKDPLDPIKPLFKPEDQRENEKVDLKKEEIIISMNLSKVQEQQIEISKKQTWFNTLLSIATVVIAMCAFFQMAVYVKENNILPIEEGGLKTIYYITAILFFIIIIFLGYIVYKEKFLNKSVA